MIMKVDEMCTDVPTAQEAVFLAHLDHTLHQGNEIHVSTLSNGESDWTGDFVVTLDVNANNEDLEHFNYEYLDPYWDVTPVNDAAKAVLEESQAASGFECVWTFGPSYRVLE